MKSTCFLNTNTDEQNSPSGFHPAFINNFVRMKLLVILIITMSFLMSCETNIFGPNDGIVSGTIKDAHNKPVKGASIKITYFEINKEGNQTEKSITRSSDSAGYYIAEVPLAEIGVLITKNGYEDVLFYDYLEQDDPKRTFPPVYLRGNPSGSDFMVLNNPYQINVNDTMFIRMNITDDYKFKKQEPYYISVIVTSDKVKKRSYTVEVPFFSNSFKVVNTKIKIPAIDNRDTIRVGNYKLKAIITDSDGLESDTLNTDFKVQ